MTLQELAALLIKQATSAPNYIQLSDQTLQQTGISALITQDLLRKDGTLYLVVDPSTIPTNPPSSGFSLSAQTPSVQKDSFLNLSAVDATINFTSDNNQIQFTLTISVGQSGGHSIGWSFSDSYPELTGLLFDELELPSPQMIFVTESGGTPAQGLTFQSTLTLNSVFQQVIDLLKGNNAQLSDGRSFTELQQSGGTTYTLTGQLIESDQGVTFDLQANLNVPSLNIGKFFEMAELFVGISQQWIKDSDGNPKNLMMLYLGAYVSVKNNSGTSVNLDLRALMPVGSQIPQMSLAIVPKSAFDTSLGNIGSLIGGQSWDDFFSGPASSIGAILNNFGLTSLITTFSLSSFSVTSVSLSVGTLQPWPLFSPLKSMTLGVNWMILFTSGNTIQNITIKALFQLTDTISFDVQVVLPDMLITGVEHGPATTLTLSQISKDIFHSNLGIPDELLTFSFSDLSIGIDYKNKIYSFGATASLDFNLFGTQILALTDMVIQVVVNTSGTKTSYTATLNGFVSLGPITFAASATLSNTADTEFELHLVNETIGSMIGHLVHLVDPTFDISFPSPWDKLFDISLDAFLLKVNVTKKTVSLTYPTNINLGFIDITGISLTYAKSNTAASSVQIEVSGSFLGQNFGQSGQPPLAWDAINQQPPAVPGAGSTYFDLQYLGLGQHITFTNLDKMTDMQAVITGLRNSVIPLPGNTLPAFGKNGLAFSKDSNWLVGAQFTVINTFSLAIIFNDPNLYGLMISLAGDRAGSFAGLSFQILYRKITDDIGVYHIELKLPDAMRNLQFGSVSLTLPVVIIDIYTNGNFRINMGFPNGLDFSNSFCLQILPFIGYGGFYFALLNGQTSTRVPKITNGNFNPVIEFGVALSIGVGKTINAGVLSGGISITVVGIVEGVIGWFNPNDSSVKKDVYYWIQGTIAIVGKLYATIDFFIIKASIDVTAYASVTLIVEAYEPIYITLSAGVSVSVSVKVLFFTIHLSFKATIQASFTIGSKQTPPWQVASGSGQNASTLQLRGQNTLHRHQQTRFAALTTAFRNERVMMMAQTAPPLNWTPIAVFPNGAIQEIDIYALPAFTKTQASSSGVDAVLLFSLENSINPQATTHAAQRELFGDSPEMTEFNLLLEGMLIWAINSKTGNATQPGATVTADDLAFIKCQLANSAVIQTAFNYGNLSSFFTVNYQFLLQAPPAGSSELAVTVFPVFPALTLTTNDTNKINIPFFNWPQPNQADALYQEKIDAYFQLLQVQFQQGTAPQSDSGCSANQSTPLDQSISMATVVLEQYFAMIAKSAVQAAIDEMETFTFVNPSLSPPLPFGIQDVISDIGDSTITPEQIVTPNQGTPNILNTGATLTFNRDPENIVVLYQIKLGDSFTSIAQNFSDQGALDSAGQPLSASDIVAANIDTGAILNPGTQVSFSGISYTTQDGDTLNLIAARLLVRASSISQLQLIANLAQITNDIIDANPYIHPDSNGLLAPGTSLMIPGDDNGSSSPVQSVFYTTVEGDTYTLVAAYFASITQGTVSFPGFVDLILEANHLQVTDPTAEQPEGTGINIPPVSRAIQSGDKVNSLAVTLITNVDVIQSSLLAVPSTTNLLAPQGVLNMPLLQYKITGNDTLGGIAQKFNLSLDQFAQQIASTPSVFASDASITVSQVETVQVSTLINSLLGQGEWNNIAGMTSRFMLNGLRLPDPNNSYFENLTVQQLQDPTNLAAVITQPMYLLTGQQFAIDNPPPSDYLITLTNTEKASWIVSAPDTELTELQFGLTADQLTLISEIASTPFNPQIETLTRLELFQMVPPRFSLQKHLNWQAAALPAGSCISTTSQATGGPTIWIFPDSLVSKLSSSTDESLKYQIVVGTHEDASQSMVISDVKCYNWATMLDLTISLPPGEDGLSPSTANTYIMLGADQNGRDLLQSVYQYLTTSGDSAELFLLYSPNPTSANPSGLNSDSLDPNQTFLLKTNLSTLSHSGPTPMMLAKVAANADSDDTTYSATLQDAADFIKLLWEDSIVYSGGYYLNYDNVNGNVGLPGQLFSQGNTATHSLFILLKSQMSGAYPPIYSFNNCAVIGDNIDASQANVFVQPVTYIIQTSDTLTSVASYYSNNFGGNLKAVDVANLNADVPLLLQIGASIAISNTDNYTIQYGDTLQSIADAHSLSVTALINTGNNAQAEILAVGAQVQFTVGILQPAATVPPGNVGFELTRTNPDPNNLPYNQLTAEQIIDSLFHLFGYSIAGTNASGTNPGFVASGVGLPTGPTESDQDGSDGLTARNLTDTVSLYWNYKQTVAVAPFATSAQGSLSPALPAASSNPYAGVGSKNEVTLNFVFQDIYGNQQPAPSGYTSLNIPVGYYDDIIALSRWPGLAAGYLVIEGTQPQIQIELTIQINKYLPSSSVTVASALKAAGGDAATYTQVYYQIQQSDLNFALETSLNQKSMGSNPPVYPICPETPFTSFVNSALVFLSAIQTLQQFVYTTPSGDTVQKVTDDFGVTAAQLFDANGDQAYSSLFGTAPLNVPVMYTTLQGDSLNSISSTYSLSPSQLATNNSAVDLNPGADLVAPNRPYITHDGYTLQQIAEEWRCTVEGIAEANHNTPNIIKEGNTITISGVSYTTGSNDRFDSIITAFANQKVALTIDELADAIAQTVPNIFIDGVTLTITDIVIQQGDSAAQPTYTVAGNPSLAQIAAQLNRSVIGIALANHNIPGILNQKVNLSAFGASVSVGANDTFDTIATALTAAAKQPVTVPDVAVQNQSIAGIFADQAVLQVTAQPDTFGGLATTYEANGFSIDILATGNSSLQNIFASGTAVFITTNQVAAEDGDTLSDYASKNKISTTQLSQYNSEAVFVTEAALDIPYLVTNTSQSQAATYVAQSGDFLQRISEKFATASPTMLATYNQDLQGLFATGQTITDPKSEKSVTTQSSTTFNSIITGFADQSVTLSLEQLASIITTQPGLLQTGGIWITPVMEAGNSNGSAQNTLSGLAAKYNLDVTRLGEANAAVQGFLASGVTLTFEGQTITTQSNDTFNSLVNRFNQLGLTTDVPTLIAAFENVNNLLNPSSLVVPLPANTTTTVGIAPDFSDSVFELIVDIVMRRNVDYIDPDFANVQSVSTARTQVSPEPDPTGSSANGAGLSLTEFASSFQQAMPGLYVATGQSVGEFDSSSARRMWVVNFGYNVGDQINYQFAGGSDLQYFAVPPLSTSLISGQAQIQSYVSGQGLVGTAQNVKFQSIDLDVWAQTFLSAVDLFLSPSYAVPAYQIGLPPPSPPLTTAYDNVITQKQTLAKSISDQVKYILQIGGSPDPNDLADAKATLEQALLVELGSAYSINSLVQSPVTVTSKYTNEDLAPRLSGKPVTSLVVTNASNATPVVITSPGHNLPPGAQVVVAGVQGNTAANGTWTITVINENNFSLNGSNGAGSQPYVAGTGTVTISISGINDYSLSNAKVPLVNGAERATFLLTVKSPADNAQAKLALRYVINELEMPESSSVNIGDYQPSSWLTFILPIDTAASTIGAAEIPIPLRAYPPPVTLLDQTGRQSFDTPSTPEDLADWDYGFTYQHLDADQDTTSITVQFNTGTSSSMLGSSGSAFFQALAQFIYVYPQLKVDLALLPSLTPSETSETALVAINTFSDLVTDVAEAWGSGNARLALGEGPSPQIFKYTLQRAKNTDNPPQLTTLTVTADKNNPATLWPEIEVNVNGQFEQLTLQSSSGLQAIYDYPSGVLTGAPIQQQFTFSKMNVFDRQDGWAGVSITRNADLGAQTNPDFIYQTPVTGFSSVVTPYIYGANPIDIKSTTTTTLAEGLGQFFESLLTGDTATQRNIRVACNYGYQMAGANTVTAAAGLLQAPSLRAGEQSLSLIAFMPVLLIPSYPFQLGTDWNWQDATSFVSQLAQAVVTWNKSHTPATTNGAFFFDISIYSTMSGSGQTPLSEATEVRYVMPLVSA